jgi:hypothetical protein
MAATATSQVRPVNTATDPITSISIIANDASSSEVHANLAMWA